MGDRVSPTRAQNASLVFCQRLFRSYPFVLVSAPQHQLSRVSTGGNMRKVSGFTIIELIVVITILGILTAVALPKFFSITTDAQKAAAAGFAGAIASGSAVNYSSLRAAGSVTTGAATAVNT